MSKEIKHKIGTCKVFTLNDAKLHVISLSVNEIFGKADTVLVSKDKKVWISHTYDEFMDAVNNGKEIRVS